MQKKKVLIIGWDACEWKVVNELIAKGLMPTLKSFLESGASGKIATLDPPISPMLWTSIATGKRPEVHGITGFTEPDPDPNSKSGVRPVTGTSRKVKAIWNILNQEGYKSNIVGWWPTHPAEPINGCMVSNFYPLSRVTDPANWQIHEGTIHPAEMSPILGPLRVHITEFTGAIIKNFVPDAEKIDQEKDRVLFNVINTLSHATSIHNAATYLMENEPADFTAIYYDAMDHFSHAAMKFHPPKQAHIEQEKFDLYKGVITAGYRYHDMMLERLLELTDENTTIMIISDHGFHPDHLRPQYIPAEPSGPTYEHSPYGFFAVRGPGIAKNKKVFGGSVIDITPTILSIYDLPVGKDMVGRAMMDIYEKPKKLDFIESWEKVEGNDGMHSENTNSLFSDQEAMNQLIELGYIEKPDEDKAVNIKKCLDESNYNLARGYISTFRYDFAIPLLEDLCKSNEHDLRFSLRLFSCYLQKGMIPECEKLIIVLRDIHKDKVSLGIDLSEGLLEMAKNNTAVAKDLFNNVLQKDPYSSSVLTYIAQSYSKRHLTDEAEEHFKRALKIDPHNIFALEGLAKVFMDTEREEEAFDVLMVLIEHIFFFPRAHILIGEILIRGGYYQKAVESFELTLGMNQSKIKSLRWLIEIYSSHLSDPEKLAKYKKLLAERIKGEIIIVTGLPRSGTSMVMQMLEAAGVPVLKDDVKKADEFNPNGYYEYTPASTLSFNLKWLSEAVGKAIKVPCDLIEYLPDIYDYKIIYIQRDFNEILKSSLKTNVKLNDNFLNSYPTLLAESYGKYDEILSKIIEQRPLAKHLYLNYNETAKDKLKTAEKLVRFVNQGDSSLVAGVIEDNLYCTKVVYN